MSLAVPWGCTKEQDMEMLMGKARKFFWVSFLLALASGANPDSTSMAGEELRSRALGVMAPLEPAQGLDKKPLEQQRAALGRLLFFEPRVSLDGTVSCSRCHLPQLYGIDGLPRSVGVMGRLNPRNAPTVLNAFLQISQHWRGDRESLEDQAIRALVGAPSFGNPSLEAAMARLKAIEGYHELFKKAFPQDQDPVNAKNWGLAIGVFERTLVSPSRLDEWLLGSDPALSAREKRGLERFLDLGCADCHSGTGLGGSMYEKFGIHMNYWEATGSIEPDRGRADVTGDLQDLYVFKVPSLRNVAVTPPYFHDGSVPKLERAVQIMGSTQLGRQIQEDVIKDLSEFLKALTGTVPKSLAEAPLLPQAGLTEVAR